MRLLPVKFLTLLRVLLILGILLILLKVIVQGRRARPAIGLRAGHLRSVGLRLAVLDVRSGNSRVTGLRLRMMNVQPAGKVRRGVVQGRGHRLVEVLVRLKSECCRWCVGRTCRVRSCVAFVIVNIVFHDFVASLVHVWRPGSNETWGRPGTWVGVHWLHGIIRTEITELRFCHEVVTELLNHVAGEHTEDIALVLSKLWRRRAAERREVVPLERVHTRQTQMRQVLAIIQQAVNTLRK